MKTNILITQSYDVFASSDTTWMTAVLSTQALRTKENNEKHNGTMIVLGL